MQEYEIQHDKEVTGKRVIKHKSGDIVAVLQLSPEPLIPVQVPLPCNMQHFHVEGFRASRIVSTVLPYAACSMCPQATFLLCCYAWLPHGTTHTPPEVTK